MDAVLVPPQDAVTLVSRNHLQGRRRVSRFTMLWDRVYLSANATATISILDSLTASGSLFAIQIALILLAPREDFGNYSLLISYVLAGQMMLASVFGSPLITVISSLPEERRSGAIAKALRWQLVAVTWIAALGALLLWSLFPGVTIEICIGEIGTFIGFALRDFLRVGYAIELRPIESLKVSLAFAVLVFIAGVCAYAMLHQVRTGDALLLLGICCLLVAAPPVVRTLWHAKRDELSFRNSVLLHSRWAIPGVVVIWLQNNLYLSLIAVFMNVGAVAEISAARMIAMPYLIAAGGVLRINQVNFGLLLSSDNKSDLFSSARRWFVGHLLVCTMLAGGLAVSGLIGLQQLMPRAYPHMIQLAAIWMIFAGVTCARGVVSSFFLAQGRYREVFIATLVSLPVVLAGLGILIPALGLVGGVLPLILGEIALISALGWRARPFRMLRERLALL